tara:strand:+ start:1361 stop:1540 length:180 start_codon:yes stop_codon:yes gene_type:complete
MARTKQIRVTVKSLNELNNLKEKNDLSTIPKVVDFILNQNKRLQILENKMKLIHSHTIF